MSYWCFDRGMLEQAYTAYLERTCSEAKTGMVPNHARTLLAFLDSPEAAEHKLRVDSQVKADSRGCYLGLVQ